jgi:magnesium transporter
VWREAAQVGEIAREVGLLEQRVMAASDEEPQEFLTQLFTARHELLTIRTMAAQGGEIIDGPKLTTFAPPRGIELMKDLLDQYERLASISQAQLDCLMAVTEFYRARRNEDDHRGRAAGRDRSGHPADHRNLLGGGHEHHRQ